MTDEINRKKLFKAFEGLHEKLSAVRETLNWMDDDKAQALFEQMEYGLLSPMRKLRIHLNIPYVLGVKGEVKEIPE